jgi:hypothetical protein
MLGKIAVPLTRAQGQLTTQQLTPERCTTRMFLIHDIGKATSYSASILLLFLQFVSEGRFRFKRSSKNLATNKDIIQSFQHVQ